MAYLTQFVDSYSEENSNAVLIVRSGGSISAGQSFMGRDSALYFATFYLGKSGSPTGNAYAKLYAHSGEYGTDSVPTGEALATSEPLDVSEFSGPAVRTLEAFTFSGDQEYVLKPGVPYCIAFEYSGGDADNYCLIGVDTSSPSHLGNKFSKTASSEWTADIDWDVCFYVGGEATPTPGVKYLLPAFKVPL